jgi:exonuclease III
VFSSNGRSILAEHNYACTNSGLKFYVQNVCGLKQKLSHPEFIEMISNVDIFALSETKLDDADYDYVNDKLSPLNFNVYMKNRFKVTSHKSGGILVGIKKDISKQCRIIESETKSCLWFKLDKSLLNLDQDLVCGAVYLPPEGSKYANIGYFHDLEAELLQVNDGNNYVCIMGDFNSRTGHLADFVLCNDYNKR